MCGRYTITVTLEELLARYEAENMSAEYQPRYNIAPGQMVPAVIAGAEGRRLGMLRWGLVPPWADDPKIGNRMINARAETLEERPAYRNAYRTKRCLIPADGFYEWKKIAGGPSRPFRITLRGGGLFSLAGLYETWTSPDGDRLHTCAVLTTEPNRLMADIHDRMPVILRKEDEDLWLDRRVREPAKLAGLLAPYPAEEMEAYEVGRLVGNVANDVPACLEKANG
ncbi:putative SOS response-associated peptidase YoqW [Cohnella xylanilytica]|uniref:Abasic site processing protein n=1 Tax=Cohnella xylanilytica TaxID=557555 RepID=A0A841TZX6_9BACL|nr:SOS response-associated peptidase [Cohnella xylanilytica]MBB6693119.1 SOS response-associated peptidase [Cohnella xylanilytica]GIO10756.1 putative SOS response-associated peptidase YoqW [Cohnella xylanilytica]